MLYRAVEKLVNGPEGLGFSVACFPPAASFPLSTPLLLGQDVPKSRTKRTGCPNAWMQDSSKACNRSPFLDIEQVRFLSRPLVAIEKTLRVCPWNVPPTVTVGSHGG